jgi:phage terminase large subunit
MAIKLTEQEFREMRKSLEHAILRLWKLQPQPVKSEFEARWELGLCMTGKAWDKFCETVKPDWFMDYEEGKHLTWQQTLIVKGVDKAMRGECSARISVVSGHGIGKSAILSMIILWFLLCRRESQVACTSPGKEQMYDVLWKELKKWIDRMPEGIAEEFEWESQHVRMKRAPQLWFARAKTSSKENTEALAGVHADWVMMAVDEASGVEEPIFETMEGALTSGNVLVFLISNGTRSIGYFYDTHHKDAARWQNYSFSSLDSPRVDVKYVDGIVQKYGSDSVQYAIRVLGQFPDEGIMDDKGYVQLFAEKDLHIVPFDSDWQPVGRAHAALDASGEGQDTSEWAIRDRMRGAIVASEQQSSDASMATKSLTVCDKYKIHPSDFTIDAFGKGMNVGMEIALATSKQKRPWRVHPINVGDPCLIDADKALYVNIRAMLFYKMMLWCRAGGEFMDAPRLKDELLSIRFKRTINGRIQIMDKVQMKKLGFPSPNKADALSMTFLRPDSLEEPRELSNAHSRAELDFDPYQTMQ